MPLNISIDVDGTLLDENEKPVAQAHESLQLLKDAGHCLQLWSGGGAEYAEKIATKFNLTHLFDSYAKKPDVAIDDLPETARPLAVIHVDQQHTLDQAAKKALRIEQNVDAALTLSSPLVSFIKELQSDESNIRERYGRILCPKIPLHPIPFFGIIENARAVTIGLNPSTTEFEDGKKWPPKLTACHLTQLLVRYFRFPDATPHCWFGELQRAFQTLNCPFHFAAAHIDVTPWTTYSPTFLSKQPGNLLSLYNEMLTAEVQTNLPRVLEFCKTTVKLVVIIRSDDPKQAERDRLPVIRKVVGKFLGEKWHGEIVIKTKSELCEWTFNNKERLIRLLDLENVFP